MSANKETETVNYYNNTAIDKIVDNYWHQAICNEHVRSKIVYSTNEIMSVYEHDDYVYAAIAFYRGGIKAENYDELAKKHEKYTAMAKSFKSHTKFSKAEKQLLDKYVHHLILKFGYQRAYYLAQSGMLNSVMKNRTLPSDDAEARAMVRAVLDDAIAKFELVVHECYEERMARTMVVC